jgi:hypothetical protein
MTNRQRIILGGIVIAAGVLLGSPVARAGFCYFCGSNSATVGDGVVFDELNSRGDRRPGGPKLAAAKLADGTPVTVKVKRHFLSAVAGKRTYTGQELVGMVVDISLQDGRAYQLKLVNVWDGCRHNDTACDPKRKEKCNRMTFWVSPFEEVPYYEFKFRKTARRTGVAALDPDDPKAAADPKRGPDRPLKISAQQARADGSKTAPKDTCSDRCKEEEFVEHICNGDLHADDDLWSTHRATAIVFEGDRYDPDNKTVSELPADKGWFNLACAGTAPFKMHMLRHTRAGSVTPDGTPRNTTLPQRTAMLKAITADYCGDGRGWTGDGTKLWWADAQGWFQHPTADIIAAPDSKGIEAIWGPSGALCLNSPRRLPEPPAPLTTYPACDAPSVQRPTVETICRAAKKQYTESPPGLAKAPTTAQIPPCDAAWADWWKKQSGKSATAATPYVLTVNREKHLDAAKYCNPSGNPVPP